MQIKSPHFSAGFTIIELLVVIVVIGILATITIIGYNGINKRAIIATLQSDLSNGKKQLEMFMVEKGNYPDTINCYIPVSNTNTCFRSSPGNRYVYRSDTKILGVTNVQSSIKYYDTGKAETLKVCTVAGFIPVPGNAELGTDDFCVMKYEAKVVAGYTVSQAAGIPRYSIDYNTAKTLSANVENCDTCKLITDAQYLTIAYDVLSDTVRNWQTISGGPATLSLPTRMCMGHSKNSPASILAVTNTEQQEALNKTAWRRTLYLSNNQVIWDLAGNASEITSDTIYNSPKSNEPQHYQYGFPEWLNVTERGDLKDYASPYNSSTDKLYPLAWGSFYGMGRLIWSDWNLPSERVIVRGGDLTSNQYYTQGTYYGGIFTADTRYNTANLTSIVNGGFRAAYYPYP